MALPFYNWSRTAADNATADSTVNWSEGQAPSTVNDSGRAMMASTAAFRDDIAGAIVTGGTSTAYTVASYQVFDTLAHLDGQIIAFTPHATNGATVTLNVDSLGAKPLRPAPDIELQSNTLIEGTPYIALYNNTDGVFYLSGMGANTYGVPLAAGMDFWGAVTPSSAFAFPTGQTLSRTTYAKLFAIIGTTYGSGDGSTTFNIPDKTGRVSAMKESSASRLTTAGSGIDGTTLGAAGGVQNEAITQSTLPSYNLSVNITQQPTFTTDASKVTATTAITWGGSNGPINVPTALGTSTISLANATALTVGLNGGGNPYRKVQPTIVCNYIMRVI